jgi:hypothetical protein
MAEQQTIGGRTFSFGVIPATVATKIAVSIARVIGEPLFKAFTARDTDTTDAETAGIAAMGMIAARLEPEEAVRLMQTVFQYVTCDGARIEMDATFTGRNKEVWLVFIAALKANFSDFFTGGLFASGPEQSKTSN